MTVRQTSKNRDPHAPQGQPPGVRELLRMLVEDARLRVRGAQYVKPPVPPVPAVVTRIYARHQRLRRQMAAEERLLKSHGYKVHTWEPYGLALIDGDNTKDRAAWTTRQESRQARVRQIHQQALLDLLTLQGKDARAYLETLRAMLAGV